MIDLGPYVHTEDAKYTCLQQPFTLVDSRGSVWNVASKRYWLVCLQGKSQYKRWSGDAKGLNVMLSLIRSLPAERYVVPTDKLVEWAATDGFGRIDSVVVYREKVRELVKLDRMGRLQVWNAAPFVQDLPCLAMASKGLRVFLMGNDEAKIEKGAVIDPFDLGDMKTQREPEHDEPERDGFDLAMALADEG